MKFRRNASRNLSQRELKGHPKTYMGLGLRSIIKVFLSDGHTRAKEEEISFLTFSEKLCSEASADSMLVFLRNLKAVFCSFRAFILI